MWLIIFTFQPHKEERFMYPLYPFLGLNAAISLHTILSYFGSSDSRRLVGNIPAKLKLLVVSLAILLIVNTGILRIAGLITAYRAPLQVYTALREPGLAKPGETVCLGKEWYRFPSSYFLPNGMRVKFVPSAFDGLLPGEFNEAKIGFGFFAGTWLIPPGMNDQNLGDPGKYVSLGAYSLRRIADKSYSSISIIVLSWSIPILPTWKHLYWNQITPLMRRRGTKYSVIGS